MSKAILLPGMSGPWEVILVLLVILLLFGAKRLPDLARSLGKSLSEFRKGREEGAGSKDELPAGRDAEAGTPRSDHSEDSA